MKMKQGQSKSMGGTRLEHPHVAICLKGHERAMCDPPSSKTNKVGKVMREFHAGKLHSGSKHGPLVTSRKQAQAIGMSEAGLSRKRKR